MGQLLNSRSVACRVVSLGQSCLGIATLVFVGIAIAGCQSEQKAPVQQIKPSAPANAQALIGSVGMANPGSGLIGIHRSSGSVRFGDTYEQAKQVFPMPARGAYELRELPVNFPEPFEARGWETGQGEGFGMILKDMKVVGALYTEERSTESRLEEWLTLQKIGTAQILPRTKTVGPVRVWEWNEGSVALVLVATKTRDGLSIALGVGAVAVLSELGLTLEKVTKSASPAGPSPSSAITPLGQNPAPTASQSGSEAPSSSATGLGGSGASTEAEPAQGGPTAGNPVYPQDRNQAGPPPR